MDSRQVAEPAYLLDELSTKVRIALALADALSEREIALLLNQALVLLDGFGVAPPEFRGLVGSAEES